MLYLTGDVHGDMEFFLSRIEKKNLGKDDTLVILGDFAFEWNEDLKDEWENFDHPYRVLFVDGNHENYTALEELPRVKMFGSEVREFVNNTYRLLTGHMYNIEGYKCFVFGGALSLDKDTRLSLSYFLKYGQTWWEEEIPTPEMFKMAKQTLKDNDYTFDLFLSHTAPHGVTKKLFGPNSREFDDPVEKMLLELEKEIINNGGKWGSSWFGHMHSDRDVERYHCRLKKISRILSPDTFENI